MRKATVSRKPKLPVMTKLLLFFLLLFSQIVLGQDTTETRQAFNFIDSSIRDGEFGYEINELEYSQEIQNITAKFQQSIATNKIWFEEYLRKNLKEGEGLPYHEKFGITEAQYHKIKNLQKVPPKLKPVSLEVITATKKEGKIIFKSKGDLKVFDLIEIDVNKMTLKYAGEIVPYSHIINAPSTTPLGQWRGYSFKVEAYNESDELKFDMISSKIIEINFGRTHPENRIVFRIKHKELTKGKTKVNNEVVGFIK